MDIKRMRLMADDQPSMSGEDNDDQVSIEDTLEQLFNKKYVYPKNAQWSLESTSVLGPVMRNYRCEQNERQNHKDTQSECTDDSLSHKGRSDPDSAEEHVTRWTTTDQEFSGPPTDQARSPRYQDGRHQPPNKFRRKTARCSARHGQGRALPTTRITLPKPWRHEELLEHKDRLNSLKDQLSDKEMASWHQHTNFTNPAGRVVGEVKTQYGAELCTQAWCKFHELLASQPQLLPPTLLTSSDQRLHSVHLCEAPGGFITSLNHFLVTRDVDTQTRWRWLGTTLNPYYEGNDKGRMISDDRFIRTTHPHWFFGADNSGDLMSVDNMRALMERARSMGPIHLVTADGSIDCQENPAEQEVIVSRLHHCEVLCSCLLLAPGGSLVLKLFTMWEASSIALLFFLNCAFHQVSVCKPATSKSGNSEVYAVCSGYTAPLSHQALFSLFSTVCAWEDDHVVLLPREDIAQDFLEAHQQCCLYFSELQSQTIATNLRLYGAMTDDQRATIHQMHNACIDQYVQRCQLTPISNQHRIKPYGHKSYFTRFSSGQGRSRSQGGVGNSYAPLATYRLQGTFQQRQQQSQAPWGEQLQSMGLYTLQPEDIVMCRIKRRQKISDEAIQQWQVKRGRPFVQPVSSQFVTPHLLADLRAFMQHAQIERHQQQCRADCSLSVLEQAANLLRGGSQRAWLYHVSREGSLTGLWAEDFPQLAGLGLQRLEGWPGDLASLDSLGSVGLIADLTNPQCRSAEEVTAQTPLLELVLHICSYLQPGSCVALIMPVALTRLTAGLLYILTTLFQETSFAVSEPSPFLYQTLVLQQFSAPSYALLTLLETLRHAMGPSPLPATRCLDFCQHPAHTCTAGTRDTGTHDTNTHNTDTHDTGTHDTGTHDTDTHNTDKCNTDTQNTNTHNTDTHKTDTYKTNIHNTDTHNTDTHNTDTHNTNAHDTHNTDTHNTDTHNTDTNSIAHLSEHLPHPQKNPETACGQVKDLTPCGQVKDLTPCLTVQCLDGSAVKTLLTNATSIEAVGDCVDLLSCEAFQNGQGDCRGVNITSGSHTLHPTCSSDSGDLHHRHHSLHHHHHHHEQQQQQQQHHDHHHHQQQHQLHAESACDSGRTCHGMDLANSQGSSVDSSTSRQPGPHSCGNCRRKVCTQAEETVCSHSHVDSHVTSHVSSGCTDRPQKLVPLEVVPVLTLINDVTFSRFLQASNGHSVTRCLTALRQAELTHLAGQQGAACDSDPIPP